MSSETKNTHLPVQLQELAEKYVESGQFRSVHEVAIAAFKMLEDNEKRRRALRGQIAEALKQHEGGLLEELEDDEFSAWLEQQ